MEKTAENSLRLQKLVRTYFLCGFFTIVLMYTCFLFVGDFLNDNVYQDSDPEITGYHNIEKFSPRQLLQIENGRLKNNCTPAAILEFPSDGFTRSQRQKGYILIHCALALICFSMLAIVCEDYFVPSVEIMSERLNLPEDIAGATFMAAASSSPELFINCIGTFVTQSDLGVGAVVGSAVFNVLAVPGFCGLMASRKIELDCWPVTRDCLMYAVSVVALILTMLDNRIYWHEALILVAMYSLYIILLLSSGKLKSFFRNKCCIPNNYLVGGKTSIKPESITKGKNNILRNDYMPIAGDVEQAKEVHGNTNNTTTLYSHDSALSKWVTTGTFMNNLKWIVSGPIKFVFWLTVPDTRKYPALYPLTFIICILWIGSISYLVAWIITAIGDTLDIPDSITGLTILAAGTSLPEAVTSVIVSNQGHGTMGISNSIGSNTFDVLLCLGFPWLIKSLLCPTSPGNYWVAINSAGLSYNTISLLSTLCMLYVCFVVNKFQLHRKVGIVCLVMYVAFIFLAVLIEKNVFSVVNLPICSHD